MTDEQTIMAEILRLVTARGEDNSICPSEVARGVVASGPAPEAWRPLMGAVRRAAIRLSEQGHLDILRKGRVVAPSETRGVIRLRARRTPGPAQ